MVGGLIHFWGLLSPNGILPAAKFPLRPSLAFLAAVLNGTPAVVISQTVAWYKEWNYGTFAEAATYIRLGGHHVQHRPTF